MQLQVVTLIFSWLAGTALGHGYLAEPPGRASAWRFGFGTPADYNDNQCYCGGFDFQYDSMGGKCGLCGDPWNQSPRDHEVGGRYATGTIVRNYVQGQVIQTIGNVTTNHLGHFEYKICANNDDTVEATQECLDLTPLYAVGSEDWHLYIGDAQGPVKFDLQLPADLTCTQCVLQWRYVAGNTWGTCENGTEARGCGPQEEFRGCADVSISPSKSAESTDQSEEEETKNEQQSSNSVSSGTANVGNKLENDIQVEIQQDSKASTDKSVVSGSENESSDSESASEVVENVKIEEELQSEQDSKLEEESKSETFSGVNVIDEETNENGEASSQPLDNEIGNVKTDSQSISPDVENEQTEEKLQSEQNTEHEDELASDMIPESNENDEVLNNEVANYETPVNNDENENNDSESTSLLTDDVESEEQIQRGQDDQLEEVPESETISEASGNSEETENEGTPSDGNTGGQQQRALKLIEEMAVALKSNTKIEPGHEQEIDEALVSETTEDDVDDDGDDGDKEEKEYESDSDTDSDEDDD